MPEKEVCVGAGRGLEGCRGRWWTGGGRDLRREQRGSAGAPPTAGDGGEDVVPLKMTTNVAKRTTLNNFTSTVGNFAAIICYLKTMIVNLITKKYKFVLQRMQLCCGTRQNT
jgi:hypothetical protein